MHYFVGSGKRLKILGMFVSERLKKKDHSLFLHNEGCFIYSLMVSQATIYHSQLTEKQIWRIKREINYLASLCSALLCMKILTLVSDEGWQSCGGCDRNSRRLQHQLHIRTSIQYHVYVSCMYGVYILAQLAKHAVMFLI